jgi:hypothetical protein
MFMAASPRYTYDGAELYGLVDAWAAVAGGRLILDVAVYQTAKNQFRRLKL